MYVGEEKKDELKIQSQSFLDAYICVLLPVKLQVKEGTVADLLAPTSVAEIASELLRVLSAATPTFFLRDILVQ